MVDKWSIKPSLAEKLVDILEFVVDKDEFTTEQIVSNFGFNATTANGIFANLLSSVIWNHMEGIRTGLIARKNRDSGKLLTGRLQDFDVGTDLKSCRHSHADSFIKRTNSLKYDTRRKMAGPI